MPQRWIPAAFIRGGTSKGVFFHENDLPANQDERDRLFLGVLGSPDPYGRQLNGMGGGISSLSKVMAVALSNRDDADIDYTFGQVAVDRPTVDYSANCGNLTAAVGPFAIDEGVIKRADGEVVVRLHNTNTSKIIIARFAVRDGVTATSGTMQQPGVPGTGAPIELRFIDPGGSRTGQLLPTGAVSNELATTYGMFTASLVDASNPVVILAAQDLGLAGTELPDELDARSDVMGRLDHIRRVGAVEMGIASTLQAVPLATPKIALVAPPSPYTSLDGTRVDTADHDLGVRIVSMERVHRAVTGTGALCLAVASRLAGTVAAQATTSDAGSRLVRLGTPSGVLSVTAEVEQDPSGRRVARSASLYRTWRPLMRGQVALP